jgi:hypothetical protein
MGSVSGAIAAFAELGFSRGRTGGVPRVIWEWRVQRMESSFVQRPAEFVPVRSRFAAVEASSLAADRDPDGRRSHGRRPARPQEENPAEWSVGPEQSLMQLPAIAPDDASQLNLHG